jgi:hypothetical protein
MVKLSIIIFGNSEKAGSVGYGSLRTVIEIITTGCKLVHAICVELQSFIALLDYNV